MKITYALVIMVVIIAMIATLLIGGKGDEHYSRSTKKNFTNLTFIYAVIIILSLVALGAYISFFF